MKNKTSKQSGKFAAVGRPLSARPKPQFTTERLEPRKLFSTVYPNVSITANVPEASGVTGAEAQFTFTRTGSTAQPLGIRYHIASASTATSADYAHLNGVIVIHGGQSHDYLDLKPVTGLSLSGDVSVTLVVTQFHTYRRGAHVASATIDESGGTTVTGQRYYVPITVAGNGFTRTDEPVDQDVNLTSELSSLNASGAIEDSSLKVVETNSSGTIINSNVPFQFDKASSYDATSNASGDLVFQLTGTTAASQTRYYRAYFDTQGTFTAPSFASQVTVASGNDAVNLDSYKVTNNTATYVMQKSTGGLSAIMDKQGHDWVGFNSSGGDQGEYRGVPNLGIPDGLHPYDPSGGFPTSGAANTATTTVLNTGPLKTTINVLCDNGNVNVTYEFYPSFVRVNVNQANETNSNNSNYWFLYEGTPGGQFSDSDSYLLSDGTTATLPNQFADSNGIGNSTEGQWAAFQSASENRFIYFANDTAENIEDSYYDLGDEMTVFGFGRTGLNSNPGQTQELSGSNSFTLGIADGNSSASGTINGQYRPVTVNEGNSALS